MISLKKSLVNATPYKSDRAGIDFSARDWLRLDWNESLEREPKAVTEAVVRFIKERGLQCYPDSDATELRNALARYCGSLPEHILVHNGSDSALKVIFDAFLDPNDMVLVIGPTYAQIQPFIASNGGVVTQYLPSDIFQPDEEELLAHIRERADTLRAVYLNNPNNPTGTLFRSEFLAHVIAEFPNILFIVDEAYYEFSAASTCIPLVAQLSNVIVTRSFSKAFRLAGIRLGYSIASPELNREIKKIHNGKDINALAHAAGIASLRDLGALQAHVKTVNDAKEKLKQKLAAYVEVHGDHGNFLVIKDPSYGQIKDALREGGILTRDRSSLPKMADCLRITITADPDANERLVQLVAGVVEKARQSVGV